MSPLANLLVSFIQLYSYVLIARILLTWVPGLDWYSQPWSFLRQVTDPVMEPFRRLIPPIAGIDFSPILLFALLQYVLTPLAANLPF